MTYVIPPALAVEKLRLAKLILRNIDGKPSIQPAHSGWLDSPFTTHSTVMYASSHRSNAHYTVLTGIQPDSRFLGVIDADTQELTDWCLLNLPETFTVRTQRGAHFYYWWDKVNFGLIQLYLSTGKKAGEIQGNRHSVRGPDQTILQVNKSYQAINPKKRISTISIIELDKIKTAFSGKRIDQESQPNKTRSNRFESISHSIKPKMRISTVLQAAHISVRNRLCHCPFHDDKVPSMSVSDEKGLAYCFACAEGFNSITLYRALKKAGKL